MDAIDSHFTGESQTGVGRGSDRQCWVSVGREPFTFDDRAAAQGGPNEHIRRELWRCALAAARRHRGPRGPRRPRKPGMTRRPRRPLRGRRPRASPRRGPRGRAREPGRPRGPGELQGRSGAQTTRPTHRPLIIGRARPTRPTAGSPPARPTARPRPPRPTPRRRRLRRATASHDPPPPRQRARACPAALRAIRRRRTRSRRLRCRPPRPLPGLTTDTGAVARGGAESSSPPRQWRCSPAPVRPRAFTTSARVLP